MTTAQRIAAVRDSLEMALFNVDEKELIEALNRINEAIIDLQAAHLQLYKEIKKQKP